MPFSPYLLHMVAAKGNVKEQVHGGRAWASSDVGCLSTTWPAFSQFLGMAENGPHSACSVTEGHTLCPTVTSLAWASVGSYSEHICPIRTLGCSMLLGQRTWKKGKKMCWANRYRPASWAEGKDVFFSMKMRLGKAFRSNWSMRHHENSGDLYSS